MKKYAAPMLTIFFAVLCFVLSWRIGQWEPPAGDYDVESLEEPAQGEVVWYTSFPESQAERLAAAFRLRTGTLVRVVRGSTFDMKGQIMKEFAGGAPGADVLTIADIGTYQDLQRRGLLMKYDSPQYASYPPQYKSSGYWAVAALFGICMAYNKDRIADPPQEWTDLLDARWRGRIGLEDIDSAGSQYGQYYHLRRALGVAFWRKLLSQQAPRIFNSTDALADALLHGDIDVAGEFSIYTAYSYHVKKGTSLRAVYPKQGIPVVLTPTAVLEGAPHPSAGHRFQDFLLSRPGQDLMQRSAFKYSVRLGMEALEGKPPLSRLDLLNPGDPAHYADIRGKYVREFNAFLEGGHE